nr:MAG TPA: hypothetical protein [Bacteriophage sp.]
MMFSQTVTCEETRFFHMVENGRKLIANDHKQRLFMLLLNISMDIIKKMVDK